MRSTSFSEIAATWREERPDAMTMKSPMEDRPRRSICTISSALSLSREERIRSSRDSLIDWG